MHTCMVGRMHAGWAGCMHGGWGVCVVGGVHAWEGTFPPPMHAPHLPTTYHTCTPSHPPAFPLPMHAPCPPAFPHIFPPTTHACMLPAHMLPSVRVCPIQHPPIGRPESTT